MKLLVFVISSVLLIVLSTSSFSAEQLYKAPKESLPELASNGKYGVKLGSGHYVEPNWD